MTIFWAPHQNLWVIVNHSQIRGDLARNRVH